MSLAKEVRARLRVSANDLGGSRFNKNRGEYTEQETLFYIPEVKVCWDRWNHHSWVKDLADTMHMGRSE